MRLWFLALTFVVATSGCGERGVVRFDPESGKVGDVESIYIGTTRDAIDGGLRGFGYERVPKLSYGRLDVSIPPDRKVGEITWPPKTGKVKPDKQFLMAGGTIYDSSAGFREALHSEIVRKKGDVILFVHGFNNNFAEGAYRFAQLGHDLKIPGTFVHYSWPSHANPLGYVYDRDSAMFARDGLVDLLKQTEAAGARRVVIVAHSMGSMIVMEVLRELAIEKNRKVADRIAGVVLMSPDIDVDVFKEQARRIDKLPEPFLIFTSKKDRALAISARLTGQKVRVGNLPNADALAGLKVTLVDTTAFSTGSGHFNVGNSPGLLSILSNIGSIDNAFASDSRGKVGLLGGAVMTVQDATQIILSPVAAIATQSGP